jgi:serine/threonine protein kinase
MLNYLSKMRGLLPSRKRGMAAPVQPGAKPIAARKPADSSTVPSGIRRRVASEPPFGARYQHLVEVDQGGSGRSHLAIDRCSAGAPRVVVLHMAHALVGWDDELRDAFARNARASLELVHPNIIRTLDTGIDERQCYWVTEFVPGQTLERLIDKQQGGLSALTLTQHLIILHEVLAGLEYAHNLPASEGNRRAIAHRNLCPSKILVADTGDVKIADYGFGGAAELTFGRFEGSEVPLAYFAPERCLGAAVDQRCDVYAVGGMLWEALAGKPRSFGRNLEEAMQIRLQRADPSIAEVRPDVAPELAAISQRALAWEPAHRYQTAREFRLQLERFLLERGDRAQHDLLVPFMRDHFREERKALERVLGTQAAGVSWRERTEAAGAGTDGTCLEPPTADDRCAASPSRPSNASASHRPRRSVRSATTANRKQGLMGYLAGRRLELSVGLAAGAVALGVAALSGAGWQALRSGFVTRPVASDEGLDVHGSLVSRAGVRRDPAPPGDSPGSGLASLAAPPAPASGPRSATSVALDLDDGGPKDGSSPSRAELATTYEVDAAQAVAAAPADGPTANPLTKVRMQAPRSSQRRPSAAKGGGGSAMRERNASPGEARSERASTGSENPMSPATAARPNIWSGIDLRLQPPQRPRSIDEKDPYLP